MSNGNNRNTECPCGSGLKLKRCHGDPMIQRNSTMIAKGMATLFVTQRMHEKELLDGDATEEAIKNIVKQVNEFLPECVELKTAYEIQEGEPKPPVDKLEEKKEDSAEVLRNLQKDTVLCPSCGRRLPAGMKCYKCNPSKENDNE